MADTFRMENEYGAFTVGSKGASLLALKMKGHDLLHDFKQNAGDWAAGAVLFPFPVRMASGTIMAHNGQEFHWPINDEKHHAALHGFTVNRTFDITSNADSVCCRYVYDGYYEFYPFPCVLEIHYALGAQGFSFKAIVRNTGTEPLPFHIGWHPYFKISENWGLSPKPTARLSKNKFSHPGEKIPHAGHQWTEEVDGAFYYSDNLQICNEDYILEITAIAPIVQIFRPANAPFIAVEPVTGLGHLDFPWLEVAPGQHREIRSAIILE
jgi:galactose mutarotase-like enzyme